MNPRKISSNFVQTYTSSSDMTTAAAVAPLPFSGENLIIEDAFISVDAPTKVTLQEERTEDVLWGAYCAANAPIRITIVGGLEVKTTDTRLFCKTAEAVNISVFILSRSVSQ